jgi:hypothetical protein
MVVALGRRINSLAMHMAWRYAVEASYAFTSYSFITDSNSADEVEGQE